MPRLSGIALAFLLFVPLTGCATSADGLTFSIPSGADQVLRAKDPPFRLHYAGDIWEVRPQGSKLQLLARVTSYDGMVSGAFGYRKKVLSAKALRARERSELDATFKSYHVDGFDPRRVNGLDVLFMRAHATTAGGQDMIIRSYLWRGPHGTADYGIVVNKENFASHEKQMMDLLNGLEKREVNDDSATSGQSADNDDAAGDAGE